MRHQQETLKPEVPVIHNPAKRLAGQLIGRWVVIMGSDLLAPVARRWKGQISEVAKAWAQFEFLPEANHNTLAGTQNPEALFNQMMAIFLRAPSNQPRDLLRSEITQRTFLLEGMNADAVEGIGDTPIEQLWTCLHFGDYTAYYLAMAYGVDPTPVAALESLKKELKARP
jgi:glucose/mannose-6-phosphate isomerase